VQQTSHFSSLSPLMVPNLFKAYSDAFLPIEEKKIFFCFISQEPVLWLKRKT